MPDYTLSADRCALIVQDLQNDVIIDGGAFAESGSPEHAKEQNVVENVKDLAAFCRGKGIPVIHVWYVVEEGAPGLKVNAPLFEGVAGGRARARHVGRGPGRRPRGAGRRLRRREDADERLAGHPPREPPRRGSAATR